MGRVEGPPRVGVGLGGESDLPAFRAAIEVLTRFGVRRQDVRLGSAP
jgi:phosphoribosylcarboxyaminoimidazole (NCAIR) mutase